MRGARTVVLKKFVQDKLTSPINYQLTASQDMSVLGSVNVMSIHERYAYDLFSWGDYEGAVGHFLVAETPVEHVLSLFPSLAPPEFEPPGGLMKGGMNEEIVTLAKKMNRTQFSLRRNLCIRICRLSRCTIASPFLFLRPRFCLIVVLGTIAQNLIFQHCFAE